jgi:Beta-lactamase class C and other penicillin binding proteins
MKAEAISAFLQERIDANDFPSAVYLVAQKGKIIFQDALGFAVLEPKRIAATTDTIYDLASLTKPLVTGLLTAKLVENGELDPTAAIGGLLPEFHISSNAEITVNQLAMHTSGLPAWRPFYLLVEHPDEITTEISRTLQRIDQEPVTYSDLNFLTLAAIVEYLSGSDLSSVAENEIISPLKLNCTSFYPLTKFSPERIAASEKGNEYEKQTCVEMGYLTEDAPAWPGRNVFRDYQIWGEVHDGNAWFSGGVAGHAGLFSTIGDILTIALQFLPNYTTLLKPETCELFRTNFTQGLNEDRSFAFQLASTDGSTAGAQMPAESFGHNGFTGTSVWIDPVNERVFVLLTNRTHAHPLPFVNINSTRRQFHDLAIDLLDSNT